MRLKIPGYAKKAAMMALRFNDSVPDSEKVGLTSKEASEKGIVSGVERARQLVRNQTISFEDAKSIARFYSRFKSCRSKRCNMAINLWGGRKFGRMLVGFVNEKKGRAV